jgi:polysaccharide export outer membrane protein
MRTVTFLLPLMAALAAAACARQQPAYVLDPQTGQPVQAAQQYSAPKQYGQPHYPSQANAPPQSAQNGRGLYNSSPPPAYAPPQSAQQPQPAPTNGRGLFDSSPPVYAQAQGAPQPAPPPDGRGLLSSRAGAPQPQYSQTRPPQYAQTRPPQSYVLQYRPPKPPAAAGAYAAAPPYGAAPHAAAPEAAYAYAAPAYTLDSGDKLRVSVFGQDGISGAYMVDAGGNLNLPLIGGVPARGFTTRELAGMIAERLRQGYVREPHVTVSIETYRPFFILGEVTTPGQYPYVPNMTVENAVAIGGGFSPRAKKTVVELTRVAVTGQRFTGEVPLNYPLQPGDTIVVKERWF